MTDDLKERAYEYLEYSKDSMKHKHQLGVLAILPPSLKGDICSAINGDWSDNISFFNAANSRERAEFSMCVSVVLYPVAFPPDESVYVAGDRSHCMYIVLRGLLRDASNFSFTILRTGDYFGVDMVVEGGHRTSTVRTMTYSECSVFDRDHLFSILDERPAFFHQTRELVKKEATKIVIRKKWLRIGQVIIAIKKAEGIPRMTKAVIAATRQRYILSAEQRRVQKENEKQQQQKQVDSVGAKGTQREDHTHAHVTGLKEELKTLTGFVDKSSPDDLSIYDA